MMIMGEFLENVGHLSNSFGYALFNNKKYTKYHYTISNPLKRYFSNKIMNY